MKNILKIWNKYFNESSYVCLGNSLIHNIHSWLSHLEYIFWNKSSNPNHDFIAFYFYLYNFIFIWFKPKSSEKFVQNDEERKFSTNYANMKLTSSIKLVWMSQHGTKRTCHMANDLERRRDLPSNTTTD